ncbi:MULTISPECIES: TetR/AcrR family transcriptional regulator [Gordonia]|uniref:Putative TetR family transcriptional regulator n=1 Tax=Gordonia aichiensis NBRC 108223 TaxID=1220583 RepID=L7KHL0_9ACTN|nr:MULTISPECIES: TetR/AcrR family transcriptional regulator [Gordonia]UEA57988.1 TetR/AcrR family transcriptional regulator [Gordonia otitidis]GAC47198.1 putative TetR family transcriptional regulator [Gordonia aichiensis NBRC 108223]
MTTSRAAANREPQQERSRQTRERLLRSAIQVLAHEGWASATVAAVAQRAGVSRGAAQHHFPTREALISSTLEQIFDDLTLNADTLVQPDANDPRRVRMAVERAVSIYTGTEFKASLQVWAAAASDPALRELILPMEARFARAAHRVTVAALDPDGTNPRAHRVAQVTLDLARGLGLADTLSDDSRRRAQVLDTWVEMVSDALAAGSESD